MSIREYRAVQDADADVRSAALRELAQSLDAIDRTLLTRDLDGIRPFLDPHKLIPDAFAQKAALKLSITIEDVRRRYEALAKRFKLHLEWSSG